jgi:hypothetical protein
MATMASFSVKACGGVPEPMTPEKSLSIGLQQTEISLHFFRSMTKVGDATRAARLQHQD